LPSSLNGGSSLVDIASVCLRVFQDCLGTLSEAVHVELNSPELIQILMPPLMQKWNTLSDDDRNIFPLLECLTAVAQALGKGFFVFAEPVFARCAQIIERNLLKQKEAVRKTKTQQQ